VDRRADTVSDSNNVDVPIVAAPFTDGEAFSAAFRSDRGPAGELALATRAQLAYGAPVQVEVFWPSLPNRVYVSARCIGRDRRGRLRLRFRPGERLKRDFLLAVAAGTAKGIVLRRHRRYSLHLPVQWRPFGETAMRLGTGGDLSVGGISIVTIGARVAPGEAIVVRLPATSLGGVVLTGCVLREQSHDDGRLELGVRFVYGNSGERRELRRLLRTFEERGVFTFDAEA